MRIFIASDHAGYELKESIKKHLAKKGIQCEDAGPRKFDQLDDYPDFIIPAVQKVAKSSDNKGIIIGGSGQGEAIAANKVKGIRAVVYYGGSLDIVKLSRTHNDSNVLSLGARFLNKKGAEEAVDTWISTDFSNEERHSRRIKKIEEFEGK